MDARLKREGQGAAVELFHLVKNVEKAQAAADYTLLLLLCGCKGQMKRITPADCRLTWLLRNVSRNRGL